MSNDYDISKLSKDQKEQLISLLSQKEAQRKYNALMYYKPYNYQLKFHKASLDTKQRLLMAANRIGKCATISTTYDTPDGLRIMYELLEDGKGFLIYAWDGEKKVVAKAHAPFSKGMHDCYRINLSDGTSIEVADHHRILLESGNYCFAEDLAHAYKRQEDCDDGIDVAYCFQTPPDLEGGYCLGSHQYDALLRQKLGGALKLSPQQVDALDSNLVYQLEDALVALSEHTDGQLNHKFSQSSSLLSCAYSSPMMLSGNTIVSVESIGRNEVFDFEVEEFHNYIAADMVHHNTFCGAGEMAYHLTGQYPKWWEGHRYTDAISAIAGGTTNAKVVEIAQAALLGEPADPTMKGAGAIPKDCIIKTSRKAGIPDAVSVILVKHVSGGTSKVTLQSYESGKEAWMGSSNDLVWLDEEPPQEIYSQALRSIVDRDGAIYMTFTPENGVTDVVNQFTNDLKDGQFIMNATWDDAPHIKGSVREQLLAAMPQHEREMRSRGIPVMGSGLVYPIGLDDITVEPIEIPAHWARIGGIDFGYDHPTAWVAIAWDRDTDTIYVYDAYTKTQETPIPIASDIIHRGGGDFPCAWPHDGLIHDKTSGATLSETYRDEGLLMLPEKFTNPPDPTTGRSNYGVEAGIMHILDRMKGGRLKVFSNLEPVVKELCMYHRKEGKIVKKFDDVLDAMRYAIMSVRFAEVPNKKFESYNPHEQWDAYEDLVGY